MPPIRQDVPGDPAPAQLYFLKIHRASHDSDSAVRLARIAVARL